jgi:hypothetical protein
MQLIDLKPRLSLEFTPRESRSVWRRLRRLGRPLRDKLTTVDAVRIAGERFVLIDDWDECALVSLTEAGDALLRAVFATPRARRPARDLRIVARQLRGYGEAIDRLTRQAA